MKSSSFILFVLSIFISVSLFSQKPPIKFGKVSQEEMEMITYEPDTSAPAVILCHYGRFTVSDYKFKENIRIKILKKTGYEWGDYTLRAGDNITFKGKTFNLENGEVVETKLKNESVFKERIYENFYVYNIAMPNVKVGSIIDIEISRPFLPQEWRFQERIPVKYNELIIEPSRYIEWRKNYVGNVSFSKTTQNWWISKDVPAFKSEPYINSTENYIGKFEIEIKKIAIPGVFYADYATSWEEVNEDLIENYYFGIPMKRAAFVNKIADEIEEKYNSKEEKIEAAFIAAKEMKWNENKRLYISKESLGGAYNDKIGNSADINLTLVAILKKMGIQAFPIAISTRDNGILNPYSPTADKLNYVLVCVKLEDKDILLDATDKYLLVGMIPKRCINRQGRIIDEVRSGWVSLSSDNSGYKKSVYYTLEMKDDLSLSGTEQKSLFDYAAYNFRHSFAEFTSEDEYLENLESVNTGLRINTFEIENLDSLNHPVKITKEIEFQNYISSAGDLLYLDPLFTEKVKENPFKLEERKYPVDFGYPVDVSVVALVKLPDNVEVVELPEPMRIGLPDNGGILLYSVTSLSNNLQVRCQYKILKPVYTAAEYPYLKEFYHHLVTKNSEPVILRMK